VNYEPLVEYHQTSGDNDVSFTMIILNLSCVRPITGFISTPEAPNDFYGKSADGGILEEFCGPACPFCGDPSCPGALGFDDADDDDDYEVVDEWEDDDDEWEDDFDVEY
tara:strand:- start:4898 stop:5224 length:327 start_codon:yes stop_codon:yes gene_type:complete